MDPIPLPTPTTPAPAAPATSSAAKPGWQTTEFWLHAFTIAGIIATSLATAGLPVKWAGWMVVAATASYGISRGLAKMGS